MLRTMSINLKKNPNMKLINDINSDIIGMTTANISCLLCPRVCPEWVAYINPCDPDNSPIRWCCCYPCYVGEGPE